MDIKQVIGEKATEYVKDGMIVGLGTGSTAYWAVKKIGELVKNGLRIKGVPTSEGTEALATEVGIPLLKVNNVEYIDITIDGADEFDSEKNLIKGGGGALLREKIIASMTQFYVIISDVSKKSKTLGSFPLPVEVTPFAWIVTSRQLEKLGCATTIRMNKDQIYVTDNNNYILDCRFKSIDNPKKLSEQINSIPGVVENGLFPGMAQLIITNDSDGNAIII